MSHSNSDSGLLSQREVHDLIEGHNNLLQLEHLVTAYLVGSKVSLGKRSLKDILKILSVSEVNLNDLIKGDNSVNIALNVRDFLEIEDFKIFLPSLFTTTYLNGDLSLEKGFKDRYKFQCNVPDEDSPVYLAFIANIKQGDLYLFRDRYILTFNSRQKFDLK